MNDSPKPYSSLQNRTIEKMMLLRMTAQQTMVRRDRVSSTQSAWPQRHHSCTAQQTSVSPTAHTRIGQVRYLKAVSTTSHDPKKTKGANLRFWKTKFVLVGMVP